MPESRIQQWKSRPVFLSSTFRDMHAERDHSRQHVFPRLEEELLKRRHHLEWIDLREGVESGEDATEEDATDRNETSGRPMQSAVKA